MDIFRNFCRLWKILHNAYSERKALAERRRRFGVLPEQYEVTTEGKPKADDMA